MALLSDKLKTCGVKISTIVKGVPSFGSGVVYVTPNFCDYNYILTAKHIFQEDSTTTFDADKIFNIELFYSEKGILKRLQYIKKSEIKSKLIEFDEDFAMIIIFKNLDVNFPQILVADDLESEEKEFFTWATFSANRDQIHKFDLGHNDVELKRFKLLGGYEYQYLSGMSGAGIFPIDKSILQGVICSYPNENFQNDTIDCSLISFTEINTRLRSLNKIPLDTQSSRHKREINEEVVDIHQAFINGVVLDLDLAKRRLKTDIQDDWFHDPLKYIDLLNKNYLFAQFEEYFGGEIYKANLAEKFYVPKKKFTLREALISPFIDRIMYMATVGVLAERLDKSMIRGVYSARYNMFSNNNLIINGVEQWKKMKYKLAEYANIKVEEKYSYGCVIEIDLLNFYDNINKKLLCDKILRVCETENEKNASKLLNNILTSFSKKELGLPQNSDASSLLASFYLNQVDTFMQHNAPAYFRFMDDIRIFCSDKFEARKILQIFEFELRRCHLSVNSQKTEIFTLVENDKVILLNNEKKRSSYDQIFDLELNKIATLRKSENYNYRNDAFHLSVKLLGENLEDEDINSSDDSARRLNYALNTIALLGRRDLNILSNNSTFNNHIKLAIGSLKNKPWITTQICKVLNLVSSEDINNDYIVQLKEIVLNSRYNTYSFQAYQIWLLLAKHKCDLPDLKKYAVEQIEKNDETNRPVIAAMVIYMCSVDNSYRRVILRKFDEKFTHGYFQNRIALISMRSFSEEIIPDKHIDNSLKKSHFYTHRYKNKDLVFIQGFDETDEDTVEVLEQLYSI